MPLYRLVAVGLAVTLCGCGTIGGTGKPLFGRDQSSDTVQQAGGLPPPLPPGSNAVVAQPLPDAPGTTTAPGTATIADASASTATTAAPAASGGGLGRTDLLGGWTVALGGDSCQLFMTLTSWTGGYRASTRGCSSPVLTSISAWNLEGKQVILASQGGTPVARLFASGNNRFDGQADGGGAISFYR